MGREEGLSGWECFVAAMQRCVMVGVVVGSRVCEGLGAVEFGGDVEGPDFSGPSTTIGLCVVRAQCMAV